MVVGRTRSMSLLQTAYLAKSRVPSIQALQSAVDSLGFDLQVDSFYQPFECSGFLPCTLQGKKSGFEIYFETAEENLQAFPHLKDVIGPRDCAITFRWGGDMGECACVLIVSAALAKSCDAIVHYQDDDLLYSADQLVSEANVALKDVK